MRPLRPPGGAPRASNAQPPGSATHRADADCRDRAARSPGARPPPSRRSSPTAGRAAAAPNARRRRPPRPDPPPPPGCVGRGALAGACASTPDHAGSTPVRGRSHASAGPRAKKGRLWSPRKKPPPPHRAPGRVERCGGEQLAWLNAPVTPVTAACPGRAPAPRWPGSSSVRIQAPATRGGCGPPQLEPSVTVRRSAPIGSRTKCRQALR